MGNLRVLGIHLIILVSTTYTCLGIRNVTSVGCSKQERLALLKFKQSLKDPAGMLSSWVGSDCCLWERIQCNGVTGNVEGVHLRGDMGYLFDPEKDDGGYLVGNEVDFSLAELMHLKYLDLSGNDFQGSMIPEFIGSYGHLSYLNLSYADFKGIIPPHIGNLSSLKVLDLSSNSELVADDMSWTLGLSSLEHLDLSSLDLSGAQNWDMVFYVIPSLEWLILHGCGFFGFDLGPFLNSSRLILPNIKHLDLGSNSFKPPLPTFFHNMTLLEFLDLSYVDLSFAWNFADMLNMIPSLSELHLSSCGLDKTFLSTSHHNNFSQLYNIQHLDLSDNSVEGIFPSLLANMSSLRVLDLSGNILNSSVPNMPNLLELDLSSNEFKQIEHVGIWRLCHLKQLSASRNPFDIEIIDSSNVSECSHYALERLYLQLSLNGTIPEPLGKLTNLSGLYLSGGRLTGQIPEFIRSLRFLEVLDLSDNLLTGSIPTFLGRLSYLDLSSNLLNETIPDSIGELTSLTYLNLGSNQLTGPIPTSLGKLVSLESILLSSNLLTGKIPVSLGQLAKLHSLVIFKNSLEGVVSEAHFANLSMLKQLDTSSNAKLTFNVSRWWIPPFKLISLRLSSCKIVDGFP